MGGGGGGSGFLEDAAVVAPVLGRVLAAGCNTVVPLLGLWVGPVELHGQVVDPGPGQGAQVTRNDGHNPPN